MSAAWVPLAALALAVALGAVSVALVALWQQIRYTRVGWWLWRRRWPSRPERW